MAYISWSIKLEITKVIVDFLEAFSFSIVDYCVTDRLMVVTAQDNDLGVADGRDGRLTAR